MGHPGLPSADFAVRCRREWPEHSGKALFLAESIVREESAEGQGLCDRRRCMEGRVGLTNRGRGEEAFVW